MIQLSKLGLVLAVHLVLARYADHLAFHTLEKIFRERHGVEIPRQQSAQWVKHVGEWLHPIYNAVWKAMRAGGDMQIDRTPVKVLDREVKGKAAQGYLWFFSVLRGDAILEFFHNRGQETPRQRLQGFHGTMQPDAYEVYHALRRKEAALRLPSSFGTTVLSGPARIGPRSGWVHCPDSCALQPRESNPTAHPPEHYRLRPQEAPLIWEDMKKRAGELQCRLLPNSTLGEALKYFLDEYEASRGYLENGRFEIDSNSAGNYIRPAPVDRRRRLFISHPEVGWSSAAIYSVLISCRRRGLEPQEYLADVLGRLPSMKITQVNEPLPAHWKPASPNTP